MKLVKMRSHWIRVALNPMTSVLKRGDRMARVDCCTGRGHVKTLPWGFWRDHSPASTLIPNLRPPKLWGGTFLLF